MIENDTKKMTDLIINYEPNKIQEFLTLKIKQLEIEKANNWIKEISILADQEKKPEIKKVAETAQELLEWHRSEKPNPSAGTALTAAFKQAVDDAQKLKIEKLSWKNVFNIFLFIPSIVNLIKSRGQAFWLKQPDIAKNNSLKTMLNQKHLETLP